MNRFVPKNFLLCSCVAAVLSANVLADEEMVETTSIAEGAVSTEEGLAAWARIYEVASHPRCANCHVGKDNLPMWSGPGYGETRPHGMNIDAGLSRIGAE